ncbi:MAG: polysaccharide biosynthesis C-terminal domain-containing protein [Ignavibacterium sp.]|nr:polysaccharide biosynthesis C-terminal domain-containing protein [Ignavibacterium sp.]
MVKKFTSTVAGGAIFISITGLLSKGLGFFREILFASFFGLQKEFDIYLVGAVLPLTINVIIYYLAQNYLIPAYNNILKSNPEKSDSFIHLNLYLFTAAGILISVLLYFLSNIIVDFYLFQAEIYTKHTASNIFRIFLITIPLQSAISVLSAYMHIKFEFRFPAYSQLILNASFLVFLLILIGDLGIYVIPVGYAISSVFQLGFLVLNTKIIYQSKELFSLLRNLRYYLPKALILIILIETIGQLYLLIDRYFYSLVPTGGIAALNYAQITFHLPLSILSVALATVLFPRFSNFISKNSFDELRKSLEESIRINIVLFIPITFILIFFGDLVLKILFERGKFSATDTIITSNVLFYFSISLIFYSIYSVFNKMLYSLGLIKHLLLITIVGILLKVLLNYIFVGDYLQDGLALSSSISYMFFFLASYLLVEKKLSMNKSMNFLYEIIFCSFSAIVAIYIADFIISFMPGDIIFSVLKLLLFIFIFSTNLYLVDHSSIKTFLKVLSIAAEGKKYEFDK